MTASFGLALFAALVSSANAAPTNADRDALKKALADVVARTPLKSARVALQVQSLDDGAIIFSENADDLLNPASNVKLFTAAAALVRLGPEHRFDTEFLTQGEMTGGRAKALYVRGKGDPSITTERLFNIVSELYHAGLREVGDIIIDDSWFDGDRLAPGFDQENSDRAYMAPTGAVSLNWNVVGIYLRPGDRVGAKAYAEVEPASDFFVIDSSLTTGSRYRRRFSVRLNSTGEKVKVIARGMVSTERGAISVWKKIDQPPLYFGYAFKRLLAERGIKAKGRIRLGIAPQQAKTLYVAQSDTFDLILKRLNKVSSNFVAEQLIKTLAAEHKGVPASFQNGIEVVEEFLEKEVGIPRGSYVMRNGSGLNDANRFSAAQINRLLRFMYERFPLAPEYLSSMGIAGKDGTLRYRFEGSEAVGRLRGKTGTLDNVSALSGYVQSVGGEKFSFALLVNDYSGQARPVVQSLDALGAAVAASGSAQGPAKAVAAMMTQDLVVGSLEEATSRARTYLRLGKQGDRRNIPFLRTAWHSEKDPAVRAVVAELLYQSNPEDSLGAQALLDSFAATDDVYGRLRKMATVLGVEVPGFSSIVELAAQGNAEALARLVELAHAGQGDDSAQSETAEALAEVSHTAPDELLIALRAALPPDREAATTLLARGLARAAEAEHPFWPALRKLTGSVDANLAAFAKDTDAIMSQKIAREKALGLPASDAGPKPTSPAGPKSDSRPGG